MPSTTDRPAPATDQQLVEDARDLAARLLAGSGARWRHVRAAAGRAAVAAPAVPPGDRSLLLAAAWLHDIGYAPALLRTGFHPLDGALYLRRHGWPPLVVALVAQHSEARSVAALRDLSGPLAEVTGDVAVPGPLADALTFADQTAGPDGRTVSVEERLADTLRRHGPDSYSGRAHAERAPAIRAAVARTERRLRAVPPPRERGPG
ncbi:MULTISPECIES: HD domain-containing protein [unclassified Blastococcus]